MKQSISTVLLAGLVCGLCSCGGGGGSSGAENLPAVGFSAGAFAGPTSYQLRSTDGPEGLAICEAGLNGLYREDPLAYTIQPAADFATTGSLTVTKIGKGFAAGTVSSRVAAFSYAEHFEPTPIPGTDTVCVADNNVSLSSVTVNRIDADQVLSFTCVRNGEATACVYDQSAVLARR